MIPAEIALMDLPTSFARRQHPGAFIALWILAAQTSLVVPTIEFESDTLEITEGEYLTLPMVVSHDSPQQDIRCRLHVTVGTASPDDYGLGRMDFFPTNDVVTIPAGEPWALFEVPWVDNGAVNFPPTLAVQISNPSPGANLVRTSAVQTVHDNEFPAVEDFSALAAIGIASFRRPRRR